MYLQAHKDREDKEADSGGEGPVKGPPLPLCTSCGSRAGSNHA